MARIARSRRARATPRGPRTAAWSSSFSNSGGAGWRASPPEDAEIGPVAGACGSAFAGFARAQLELRLPRRGREVGGPAAERAVDAFGEARREGVGDGPRGRDDRVAPRDEERLRDAQRVAG